MLLFAESQNRRNEMQAYQVEPEPQPKLFKPVALLLETQEEVDSICALLANARAVNAVGLPFTTFNILGSYNTIESCKKTNRLSMLFR